MASCILVGILLTLVGGLGGGGFWAYKKYIAKTGTGTSSETADNGTPKPVPPETPPVKKTTPPAESPPPAAKEEPPPSQEVAAALPEGEKTVPPPPEEPETPAAETTTPPAEPETPPAETAKTEVPDPGTAETPASGSEGTSPAAEETAATPAESADPVAPAEPVKTFAENAPEVAALKADADRRIDEAPGNLYSEADKEKVRDAIRQARQLTRVATLQFGKGGSALGPSEKKRLTAALKTPEASNLQADPEAVFFLIGFADSSGTSQINRTLSQKRATGVTSVLKELRIPNRAYAVGIGTSSLVGGAQQEKNRAVEVWIVLP